VLVQPDRSKIGDDGQDLSNVTVSITDAKGRTVSRSKNRVRFSVTGPGEIVAVDNGDATWHQAFQSRECNAYNGLCLVIVRCMPGLAGRITLKAVSEGWNPRKRSCVA
jgi:beta-galactosidase